MKDCMEKLMDKMKQKCTLKNMVVGVILATVTYLLMKKYCPLCRKECKKETEVEWLKQIKLTKLNIN